MPNSVRWPWGEAWCQELDVFHNPKADYHIPFDSLPGATHWFERDGDVECRTIWENSVLSSVTHVRMAGVGEVIAPTPHEDGRP